MEQLSVNFGDPDEEISPRVIRLVNPQAPQNVTIYSLKEKQFVLSDHRPNSIVHVARPGTLYRVPHRAESDSSSKKSSHAVTRARNLTRNQFAYHESGCETSFPPMVSGAVSTQPPPFREHTGTVSRSIIQCKNTEHLAASRTRSSTISPEDGPTSSDETLRQSVELDLVEKQVAKSEIEPVYSPEMEQSGLQMERILNFTCEQRIYQDLISKSYPSGTADLVINALWMFTNTRTKNKAVTAIKWNPKVPDLFAVGFGSFDYSHTSVSGGFVATYSLKNVNYPQKMILSSGVCCMDWNPSRPSLLAIGMYDGNVGVTDTLSDEKEFVYHSGHENVDQTDPVWELSWTSDPSSLSFDTVSANGRITRWRVERSKLESDTVFDLVRNDELSHAKQTVLSGSFTGLCLDYSDDLLIGTEEGPILKCSQHLQSIDRFVGHPLAVYTVRRNPFDREIFVSCSADWTIKLWHASQYVAPLCTLEAGQGASIGDVAWSPTISTMFATVNGEGTVTFFDLNVNRTTAISSKKIVKKGKLTRIAFHESGNLILVGDQRGNIYSFKIEYAAGTGGDQVVKLKTVVDILRNATTDTT